MSIGLDIDALLGGIVVRLDAHGRIVDTGDGLPELLGTTAQACLGTPLADLLICEDPGASIREWLGAPGTDRGSTEGPRVRFADRPEHLWQLARRREPDDAWLVAARRCHDEAVWNLLVAAHREVALGRLARPIAHEFNNVLHLVSSSISCIQSLVEHGDPIDDARPWLTTARSAIDRGKQRIRDLQPLLRGERRRIAAGTLLECVAGLLEYRLASHIELACESPWTAIECDPALIVELLVMLLERDDATASPDVSVRITGRPEPGGTWALTVETHRSLPPAPRDGSRPHLDGLLGRLAELAGIGLETHSAGVARLVWSDICDQDLLTDELMVLTMGPPVLRRQVDAACQAVGWDVLGADTPATAIELIEDYREELDGIIACVPDAAVDLSALRTAAGGIPFVGGDCTVGPEILQRQLCAARWELRLRRWAAP